MSVAARVDGDHFELPIDAVELLRHMRPDDQQWFIEEVTQALAVAADTQGLRTAAARARSLDRDGPLPAATGLRGDDRADTTPRAWRARGSGSRHHPAPLRVGSGAWASAQRDGSRSTHIGVLRRGDHQQRRRTVGRTGLSARLDRGRRALIGATAPSSRAGKVPA